MEKSLAEISPTTAQAAAAGANTPMTPRVTKSVRGKSQVKSGLSPWCRVLFDPLVRHSSRGQAYLAAGFVEWRAVNTDSYVATKRWIISMVLSSMCCAFSRLRHTASLSCC